ncbi:type IV secretion system protein, partial [Kingella kingae]|uniref:type IV secretion system protein n=1 Tax=Kingella kingae TaxID=504 RepID=UPI001E51413F
PAGIIILLAGVFFGIVVAYYLVAKISLAMVILIGPLFLGMMLFPSTRQYAMNWICQIFNYAVTIALFTILMSVQMNIFDVHI